MGWLRLLLTRKLAAGLIVILVLLFGVYSTNKMDIQLLPEINFDMAIVYVDAGEMSTLDVEERITKPIENALSVLAGVESYTSSTSVGSSSLTVVFEQGRGEEVYRELESLMGNMERMLPGVNSVQSFMASTNAPYEFFMDIHGGENGEMTEFALNVVKPRLEALPEVREVDLSGTKEYEIIVELVTEELSQHGITPQQIIGTLQQENQNKAIGELTGEAERPVLRWDTSYTSVENIENLAIPSALGIVKLGDLAKVELTTKNDTNIPYLWKNGDSNFIFIQVGRSANTNQIDMAEAVREEVAKIKDEGLVNGFYFEEMVAQADYVSDSINGVKDNIIIGGMLAIIVLLLFLRNIRATLIVGLSIPISLLLTFTIMWLFGYTINMLSLIALGLGIGMMVDASIVILESIYRKKEQGLENFEAVIEGVREVSTAVIASMLTTIVVFLPIGILSGELGDMMAELSGVVIITLVSSVLISFTVIPALSQEFFKVKEKGEKEKLHPITRKYGQLIAWMAGKKLRRWGVSLFFLSLLIAAMLLVTKVPMSVMPDVYNRQAEFVVMLESGTTPQERKEIADEMHNRLKSIPDVADYTVNAQAEYIFTFINMTPEEEATIHQEEVNEKILRALRGLVDEFPVTEVSAPFDMAGGSGYPVQVNIKGRSLDELQEIALGIEEGLKEIEGITGVTTTANKTIEEERFVLRKDEIEKTGLTPAQVREQIEAYFMRHPIGEMEINGIMAPIVFSLDKNISDKEELMNTIINSPAGQVELRELVSLEAAVVPVGIERDSGERIAKVMADIEGRDLGSVNLDVQALINDFDLPLGYMVQTGGQLEQQKEAFTEMIYILLIAIFLVYVVMSIQFNSLIHPLVVMSVIPMTFVGVILGLLITQRELSIISAVGVVMLIGIVLNNAILLIDRTKQLRLQGKDQGEALQEAGQARMRPIFMTTFTTAFGMLPLAMATGSAGNFQTPMATVVISGLLFATLITLILIPAVYMIFEDVLGWPKRLWLKRKEKVASQG